uniref:Uncharacterized protein n=1 Tax=Anguilla anguilla TaxID=7936 RepID=A0A0E9SUU3_ANGAN
MRALFVIWQCWESLQKLTSKYEVPIFVKLFTLHTSTLFLLTS